MLFVWVFCGFYGCSMRPEGSSPTGLDSDVLAIKFISPSGETMRKVEIPARPGIPFVVKTNDEAGNRYQVTGKLQQKVDSLGFEHVRIGFEAADGADSFSGVGPSELERGREWSMYMVAGATLYGYSVCYANRATPVVNAVPGANGLATTVFVVHLTNTIGGPPIPVGTAVYEQVGTNPPRPINVKVGSGNTYEEVVGFFIPVVPTPSAAEAQYMENLPPANPPGDRISFTNKGNIYIDGTNVGTISRIITLSSPAPGKPVDTVTIKAN
jgi:hypothetical protein